MKENYFAYGGYHFIPVGKLKRDDDSFHRNTRYCGSDFSLGLSTYVWKKAEYSYDGFYASSTDKESDLFLCIENGRVYMPAMNELFAYTDRKRLQTIQAEYGGIAAKLRFVVGDS